MSKHVLNKYDTISEFDYNKIVREQHLKFERNLNG